MAVGLTLGWLAVRVPQKTSYLLMRWIFGLIALVFRGDQAKDAELLVLRLENAVLRRTADQVRYEPADRVWFACAGPVRPPAAGRRLPGNARAAAGLAPQARRAEVRHEHAPPARPTADRPEAPSASRGRTRCGRYGRIHGELTKIGGTVAPPTVFEILRAAGIDPAPRRSGPTWRQFLHAQAARILAVDFLQVDTVLLTRLYTPGRSPHEIEPEPPQLAADRFGPRSAHDRPRMIAPAARAAPGRQPEVPHERSASVPFSGGD
jgi:putative transposase